MNYIKLFLNIYSIVITIIYSIALYYLFTKVPRNELTFSITSKEGIEITLFIVSIISWFI